MPRRLHVAPLTGAGEIDLPQAEAHHARAVLRLKAGDPVELFDDAGRTAAGTILLADPSNVRVQVEEPAAAPSAGRRVAVASAVPKGERADWMVEKLSELGVERWTPLVTARSVVEPKRGKIERWGRIAVEAAKQSRRAGVMAIGDLTPVAEVLGNLEGQAIYFSTDSEAPPVGRLVGEPDQPLLLLVGPEGGWTGEESAAFAAAAVMPAILTSTVLRVETAAVLAAGVALLA